MIRGIEYGPASARIESGDRFALLMWGYEHCSDATKPCDPGTATVPGGSATVEADPTSDDDLEEIIL